MRNALPGDAAGRPIGLGDSFAWLARAAVSLVLLGSLMWLMLASVAGRT